MMGDSAIRGLSRRQLLVGLVTCAGALAACGRRGPSARGRGSLDGAPMLVLSDAHAATLPALAEVVLPNEPGTPSIAGTGLIRRFDEEFYFVEESVRQDMLMALAVLEWQPLAAGHLHRFSRLDAAARSAVVERLLNSRFEVLRAIATSLRVAVLFFYYAHPATWPVTGFDGPFSHLAPQLSEQRLRYRQLTARQ